MATKKTYRPSPFGRAVHPWINRPDTKFGSPVFKCPLRLDGAEAIKLKELVDEEVDAYYTEQTKDLTAAERKKWTKYYPYNVLENDDGTPNGGILFLFKQNAVIRLSDGTEKEVTIAIKDAKDKDMHKPVYGGSVVRVMFAMRGTKMATSKQFGIRLDFSMVQVKKLIGATSRGFGEVEGGYEDDGDAGDNGNDGASSASGAESGDY